MRNLLPLAALLFLLHPSLAFAAISGVNMLDVLLNLFIWGLIFWAIWWFIGFTGPIPEPFNKLVRVILGLFALIIIINILLSLVGRPFMPTLF